MTFEANSLILTMVPLLGGLLGFAVWSQPNKLKMLLTLVTLLSLASVIVLSGQVTTSAGGSLLLYLLPLAACVSLLVQFNNHDDPLSSLMTVVLLGLGLGALTSEGVTSQIFLAVILGLVAFLLFKYRNPLWSSSWTGIGVSGFAAVCAGFSAGADASAALIVSLLVSAVLLPLLPLQAGYVMAVTRLPGSLPAFMIFLLPVLGLNNLAGLIVEVPEDMAYSISILALVSIVFATLKAMLQSRVPLVLAYSSSAFFAILWWFLASSQTVTPQNVIYLVAVALMATGLMLAWQVICSKYGDDVDMRAVHGLVWSMPQFAVLLTLVALAAMGMPPFGVFAGFVGMLLTTAYATYIPLIFILAAWLAASWYIMSMVQKMLFGQKQLEIRQIRLHQSEFASLLIIVLISVALGVLPSDIAGI
ncbi:NADH-quinone oxidoreductase subunit M [Nitrosomonas sp. Nm51]|uniref:proton-conducting transporter transmembrane domain-containing protein n=1 Tax=Nitrosomonas sp. Nm51 TaxID=133720 RepID=UPI0008BBE672|nr:proton-conducting transporter membrane subunit [Nitrosomonas sp. Nm51]SEQ76533.1 NADH-quinone oxidoreductase subunit M [Nitrosomonas sp. Nm51]